MNKTKKVLSIILITLLIISTVFTLMKKVGLCASSSTNPDYVLYDLPLPFGLGSNVGYSENCTITEDLCISVINKCNIEHPNYVVDTVCIYEESSTYTDVLLTIGSYFLQDSNYTFHNTWGYYAYRVFNNGTITYSGSTNSFYTILTNSVTTIPGSSDIGFPKGVRIIGYPIYSTVDNISDCFVKASSGGSDSPGFNHYFWQNYQDSIYDVDNNNSIWKPNYQNPSNQQNFWDNVTDFFNRSFKSLLGGISGGVKTIGDYIEQFYNNTTDFWGRCIDSILGWLSGLKDDTDEISDDTDSISGSVSSIDSRLSSFFGSFWGNFDDYLEDFVQGIWGDLPDIMKAPYRIAQWFYQHGLKNGEFDFMTLWHYLFDFDSSAALNSFSNNKYGDFLLDVRDFFNTFFGSITDQTASSRVFFVIPIGTHFGSDVGDVEINFDWYSSIRDNYLPYFMAFLYISVIWLFFKRLPDILRGIAGAESSFSDSLPYDTEHITHTSSGVYTSNTHVSNGGRSRVTYNTFKKN